MQYHKRIKIRIPRTDQAGLKYPKCKTVDVQDLEDWTPESTVQGWADAILRLRNLYYIRLPEALFINIFRNPQIPLHIKRKIKYAIAGLPDNIVQIPITDKFCLSCNMENKKIGKGLKGRQKILSKEVPYNITQTEKEIIALMDEFQKQAEIIKTICMGEPKMFVKNSDIPKLKLTNLKAPEGITINAEDGI